jgi:hypothetical protein
MFKLFKEKKELARLSYEQGYNNAQKYYTKIIQKIEQRHKKDMNKALREMRIKFILRLDEKDKQIKTQQQEVESNRKKLIKAFNTIRYYSQELSFLTAAMRNFKELELKTAGERAKQIAWIDDKLVIIKRFLDKKTYKINNLLDFDFDFNKDYLNQPEDDQ